MKKTLVTLTLAFVSASFAGCAGSATQGGPLPQIQAQGGDAAQLKQNPQLITIGNVHSRCSECVGVPSTGGSDGVGTSAQNPGGCPMARRAKSLSAMGCSGGRGSGGDDSSSQIACDGTPTTCANIPCNGSQLSIGSIFQWNGQDAKVTDINSLWESFGGISRQVGWIYQASNGARYIQGDLTSSFGVNFSVSAGLMSAGVSSPGAYTPLVHYSGYLPSGAGSAKCETQGGAQLA